MARTYFNPISDPLTRDEATRKLNRFDLARFHYFNANGVHAEWTKLGNDIMAAADAGRCKNGAWVAYGPIGYFDQQLFKMTCRKQFKVSELMIIVKLIDETIAKGREFLANLD